MLKRIGLPVFAFAILLVLFSAPQAQARVHWGISVGPAYPVNPYPYYADPYYDPYYGGYYVAPYGSGYYPTYRYYPSYGYGYRGYDRDYYRHALRERREHEWREREHERHEYREHEGRYRH